LQRTYSEISSADRQFGPLALADLESILAIELGSHSHPWSAAVFRDCFKAGYERWGLWSSGELVGFAILCWQFDELHLLNLCVRHNCRRLGLGRRLLRFAIASARAASSRCMLLEVRVSNQGAIELYKKEGFTEIGRRKDYYPAAYGREDALVMTLPFTAGG
jgi:ribosomal-protein-alanine N-acetyltransferase